jgi:hypothetical protein
MMNGGWPLSQGGDVLASGLEGKLVCGVRKSKTMFFHPAILYLWVGLSIFHKIVGGKGMFLCFYVF